MFVILTNARTLMSASLSLCPMDYLGPMLHVIGDCFLFLLNKMCYANACSCKVGLLLYRKNWTLSNLFSSHFNSSLSRVVGHNIRHISFVVLVLFWLAS